MGSGRGPPIVDPLALALRRGRPFTDGSAMSASLSTATPRAVGSAPRAAVHLISRVGAVAARWTLPLTGIALSAYLMGALVLSAVGFLLRFFGERRSS